MTNTPAPPPVAPGGPANPPGGQTSPRELIVIAQADAGIRATSDAVTSVSGQDVSALASIVASAGVTFRPLFGTTEELAQSQPAGAAQAAPSEVNELSLYYHVDAPDDQLDELARRLAAAPGVAAAYVKPPSEPPVAAVVDVAAPQAASPPAVTPDFSGNQIYLGEAPAGVSARYAWTVPGGGGNGVRIVDCEWAWHFDHEDLAQNQGGVISGVDAGDKNHGTAVLGEFHGNHNGIGVDGICPDAFVRASAFSQPTATTIRNAADALSAGDVLLLEIHRAGPRHNFTARADKLGYIGIEWWPDDFAAIQYATGRGVVVVEAAGNGAENFDDPLYNTPGPGFPAGWTNPFNRTNRDSRAILVGAGAPPPGTHGRDYGADRSRLNFSNYGTSVDVQGWGREVTSCGYGDLQGGGNERLWYTNTFAGTSSASPIVVGVVGSLQGVLRARGKAPLLPPEARSLLRATGCPQQDGPNGSVAQRIGNRPALRQLILPRVYFFKADKYIRFDIPTNRVDDGYPLPIAGLWPGFAEAGFGDSIDAAVNWDYVNPNYLAKAYFFKGDQYIRYDIPMDKVDPGYPLPIAGNWPGFTEAGFDSTIDAALNYGNGKAYFFKGDQYIRYDIASDTVDAGYPLPIAMNWPGFTETGFDSGIDAAMNYGNGKAFFLKGDQYIRYDIAADAVDAGYPMPIAGNWPGMSEVDFGAAAKAGVEWRRV